MAHYKNVMGAHGFDVPGAPKPAAKKSSGGGGGAAPAAQTIQAPAPVDPGKPIEKPTSGLEDTIKSYGDQGEQIVRNYLGPGRNSVYVKEDEEDRRRRKKSYVSQRKSILSAGA